MAALVDSRRMLHSAAQLTGTRRRRRQQRRDARPRRVRAAAVQARKCRGRSGCTPDPILRSRGYALTGVPASYCSTDSYTAWISSFFGVEQVLRGQPHDEAVRELLFDEDLEVAVVLDVRHFLRLGADVDPLLGGAQLLVAHAPGEADLAEQVVEADVVDVFRLQRELAGRSGSSRSRRGSPSRSRCSSRTRGSSGRGRRAAS